MAVEEEIQKEKKKEGKETKTKQKALQIASALSDSKSLGIWNAAKKWGLKPHSLRKPREKGDSLQAREFYRRCSQ